MYNTSYTIRKIFNVTDDAKLIDESAPCVDATARYDSGNVLGGGNHAILTQPSRPEQSLCQHGDLTRRVGALEAVNN